MKLLKSRVKSWVKNVKSTIYCVFIFCLCYILCLSLTFNQGVPGSNPGWITKTPLWRFFYSTRRFCGLTPATCFTASEPGAVKKPHLVVRLFLFSFWLIAIFLIFTYAYKVIGECFIFACVSNQNLFCLL